VATAGPIRPSSRARQDQLLAAALNGNQRVHDDGESASLLVQGRDCWRRVSADRASFLVDAEGYFSAVADAIERAARSVVIIGWDLDTEVRLRRDGREPATLAGVLQGAVRKNRKLRVWILLWDYALIYLLERQPLPLLSSVWPRHRRIRVRHDDTASAGASHRLCSSSSGTPTRACAPSSRCGLRTRTGSPFSRR
jgi:phosphatidylserine/phosphatidylglycerophosphate/cardiolipin synthase-like enzyme